MGNYSSYFLSGVLSALNTAYDKIKYPLSKIKNISIPFRSNSTTNNESSDYSLIEIKDDANFGNFHEKYEEIGNDQDLSNYNKIDDIEIKEIEEEIRSSQEIESGDYNESEQDQIEDLKKEVLLD